jgi:DUF4097 and DUF4098 domain-containing protein YvlB
MRRGSLIGPLLLILLGAAFLVRNVWPEIPVMDLIARYWPFLLIAWGGLRLIEILAWAARSKPIPQSGVSGGEWVAVIFLCLFGSAIYTARHYSSWLPAGRSLRGMVINMGESFDYTFTPVSKTTEKPPRIVIENFRGNARIAGDSSDKVTASGRKTIRAMQQADADRADKETPLELVTQGDEVIVRTNQSRVNDDLRVSSELDITVPKGASVEAHGRYGDFDIRDITGTVEINSDNAGVRLENIGGNVRIEVRKSDMVRATAVKGSIELKGRGQDVEIQNVEGQVTVNGDFLGQVQFRNLSQPVRFEAQHTDLQFEKLPGQLHMGPGEFTASNIVGPIHLSSRARDVQITDFTQSLEMNLERGDIELRPGRGALPKMDVRTKSGDIDVAIPVGAKFELKLATEKGEAHNEYGDPLKVEEEHRGASINGSVGTGPQLHLETHRGSVTVRKAGEGDVDLKVERQ